MHALVAFAKPFRMPDFFLISGLFLARVIDRDWRTYLDRKVVHFVYFYVLWVTIQFAFKAPGLMFTHGLFGIARLYAEAFIEPFGTLWFIYLLPIFFVVTKLTLRVPPLVIFAVAAALEIAHIQTGWTVIDEFAARFVYFYPGYVLATRIFQIAAAAQARPIIAALGLTVWALFNGLFVVLGLDGQPFISLTLGLIGAAAVVSVSALMAKSDMFAALRYLGKNSIVVYLAFFLGMAASRSVLLKLNLIPDLGTVALIVTASGIAGAVAAVLGGAQHAAPLPVRAAGLGAARATSRNTRCSRRSERRNGFAVRAVSGHDPRHADRPLRGTLHHHLLHSAAQEDLGYRRDRGHLAHDVPDSRGRDRVVGRLRRDEGRQRHHPRQQREPRVPVRHPVLQAAQHGSRAWITRRTV